MTFHFASKSEAILLSEFFKEFYRTHNPEATVMGIHFLINIPETPLHIWGQREKLFLAFENLFYNALRFTPEGGSITLNVISSNSDIEIRLTDTGCGIEPERLDHIFENYAYCDPLEPGPHGVGLGLTLSHYFAVAMGGTLVAESRVGKGSVFTLSLPIRTMARGLHDVPLDYAGGFNHSLMGLADVMPHTAFQIRELD